MWLLNEQKEDLSQIRFHEFNASLREKFTDSVKMSNMDAFGDKRVL